MGTATRTIEPGDAAASGVSPYLSNTAAFLDIINGKSETKSTTGGTDTKISQTDVSPEGITELMRQMMENTGGLADLATGAHVAGLYNDSTKTLLAQNLMAKIAGQAALASAKTTTTSTTAPVSTTVKQQAPLNGQSIGKSLLAAGIASVGSKLVKKTGILKAMGLEDDTPANAVATASAGSPAGGGMAGAETAGAGSSGASLSSANDSIDLTPLQAASDVSGAASDIGSVASDVGAISAFDGAEAGSDLSSFGDITSSGVDDIGASLASDVGSAASSGGSWASDFFDGLFHKGGEVGAKNPATRKGYADGGLVNVDRGTPTPIVPARPLDSPMSAAVKPIANPQVIQTAGSGKKGTTGDSPAESEGGSGQGSATLSTPGESHAFPSLTQAAQFSLALLGVVANPVFGTANLVEKMATAQDGKLGNGILVDGFNAAKGIAQSIGDALGIGGATPETIGGGMGPAGSSGVPNSGANMSDDSADDTTTGGVSTTAPGDAAVPDATASASPANAVASAATSDADEEGPPGGGMSDANGTADTGASSAAETASGGGYGGGDGEPFARGGVIDAPGDGSVDTRMIKAADGEFIINSQAAKAIGYDRLNWLNTILGGKAA